MVCHIIWQAEGGKQSNFPRWRRRRNWKIQLVTYGQPPYLPNGQGRASQNKVSAEEQPTDFEKIDSPPIARISVKNHLRRKSKKRQN